MMSEPLPDARVEQLISCLAPLADMVRERGMPTDEALQVLLQREELNEETFGRYLYTAGLPDPDLVIRTGGEMRLSNFLLYQLAYAELWVTPTYWPDFTPHHLEEAISSYQRRERRFGMTGEQCRRMRSL